jgi:subtilase family serine protease
MRTLRTLAAGIGAVAAATTGVATGPAAAVAAHVGSAVVTPLATRAPDSAFHKASASDPTSPACTKPDGTVSTYIHCYRPYDLRRFYRLGPLATSKDGAGQTIVLVDSYGSPTAANDLAHFANTFHGPTPSFETDFPLGSPNYTSATGNGSGTSGPTAAEGWAGEATLDIEWAYAMAPKAHLVLLATPPAETQGVQGLPNLMKAIDSAITRYPTGTMFSMSFGTDEQAFGFPAAAKAQFTKFDATFQRGIARKDTFFSSSGDTGSVGQVRSHHQSTTGATPEVSYPNVSPFVTSVGGTQVQSGWTWNPSEDRPFLADGSFNPRYWAFTTSGSTEPVWNETWAGIASGGGLSTVYGRPAYQSPVAGIVGSHRGVPDVAWNAAVNGGVLIYRSFFPSIDGKPSWQVYGGTSAASPQVAAITAIGNQAREARGEKPVGELNPVIYSKTFNQGAAFNDVVRHSYGTVPSGVLKDNQVWDTLASGLVTPDHVPGYPTTAGYDLTTGWGSPNAPGYVSQLVAHP